MILGDSREGQDFPVGRADEEEKLYKQANAFSLEGAAENGNGEEDNVEEDAQEYGEYDELLRQAIALSLEGDQE